jgi:hypothetical protein
MGLMVVISIQGPSLDGLEEPAQAAALMRVLADEVVARIPKLEPGQSVRLDPRSGVCALWRPSLQLDAASLQTCLQALVCMLQYLRQ